MTYNRLWTMLATVPLISLLAGCEDPKDPLSEELEDRVTVSSRNTRITEVVGTQIIEELAEMQKEYFEKRNEHYKEMDDALAQKDLPAFVDAYRDTREFMEEIGEMGLVTDAAWHETFYDTSRGTYGQIFAQIMANPEMLRDWPSDCGDEYSDAKSMIGDMVGFVNNKRRDEGIQIDMWEWMTIHDDGTLELTRNANLPHGASMNDSSRYLTPGTFTRIDWYEDASFIRFSLFTTQNNGIATSVTRECDVLDLGGDGIDRCDARLNGVQESQIDSANSQYDSCLHTSRDKLHERYEGTGFFPGI